MILLTAFQQNSSPRRSVWTTVLYSISHLGRLLNFWTLRVGAYWKYALIRGWALMKFSPFSESVMSLFGNKTIIGNNKTRRCNKVRFLWNSLKKTSSSSKSLISRIQCFFWVGDERRSGGGGRLLTFSAFRMGAYSRWTLIRGWAPIQINTVCQEPICLWLQVSGAINPASYVG